MNFKVALLHFILCAGALQGSRAQAFVHIHQLKPRLPVDPERRDIVFYWNGASPSLKEKQKVLGGEYADASDRDLMQALLEESVKIWNDVPTAYVELVIVEQADAMLDPDDETFSIVVEEQASKAVASAALPSFITQDSDPTETERNPRIIHDCDISVSDSTVEAQSLLRTLTHEMGHCLGLGHPHSTYHSIMSYSSLDQSARLSLDDEAGLTYLYPEPGESQKVENLTCGTLGGRGGGYAWLYLLPLIYLGARRIRPGTR